MLAGTAAPSTAMSGALGHDPALRSVARRAEALAVEAVECEKELVRLDGECAPFLVDQPGIGPISAAQIICVWSHDDRLRSEAAFAALPGVAPDPRFFWSGHPPLT